jgi:hypothetical protein
MTRCQCRGAIRRGRVHLAFDAGVVEDDVETAVSVDGGADHRLHIFRLRDIGLREQRLSAASADGLDDPLAAGRIAVGHHDVRALRRTVTRRLADTGSGARDNRNFSCKLTPENKSS